MNYKKIALFVFICYLNDLSANIRNVPTIYSTIQSALNSSSMGDTILVAPGVYYENILWPNISDLKLHSSGDSSNTIIDGNQLGRVLNFGPGISIGTNTEISGFKIQNGFVNDASFGFGAGIMVVKCSPNFNKVRIVGNHSVTNDYGFGAGVYLEESNTKFSESAISYNSIDSSTWAHGGGVFMIDCNPTFENVEITYNNIGSNSWSFGNGVYSHKSNPIFKNVNISYNTSNSNAIWYMGAGIYVYHGNVSMTNVLISKNVFGANGGWYKGGGIYYVGSNSAQVIDFMNITITSNDRIDFQPLSGTGLFCEQCNSTTLNIQNSILYNTNSASEIYCNCLPIVTYSDIRGWNTGPTNIDLDPNFISSNDFHLSPLSPCLGTGNLLGAPLLDIENNIRPFPLGSPPDMGCYESVLGPILNSDDYQFSAISVFPNPVKDILQVNLDSGTNRFSEYELIDIQGATKSKKEINPQDKHFSIDMRGYNVGIYLLKVHKANSMKVFMIIKN